MSVGDQADMLMRLRALLPPWFPQQGSAPVLDGVLSGAASVLATAYSLYAYAILQTRIATATGAWLDLIGWTYFGASLLRNPGEQDGPYRGRILAALIQPRVTRPAILAAVQQLTGYPVRFIEPFMLIDTGIWKLRGSGAPISFYRVDTIPNPARWSSRGLRCQFFIECVLPTSLPLGNNIMPAWGMRGGSDGVYGAMWMARGTADSLVAGAAGFLRGDFTTNRGEDAVYSLINSLRAAGIICWVKFVPPPTAILWDQPGATWDQPGAKWDS